MSRVSYDTKCYDLASAFMVDFVAENEEEYPEVGFSAVREELTDKLAQEIQATIEETLEDLRDKLGERRVPSREQ